MSHLVIVGGSDVGISAALRARELDSTTQVSLIVEDAFPNYSICGLPFYLSGEVPDYQHLVHRTKEEIIGAGIDLLLEQTARSVDAGAHRVTIVDRTERKQQLSYDRLILGTGARPRRPHLPGLELPGVFVLHSMAESFRIQRYLSAHPVRSVVIVGGGYIGLEMADAFTVRGLSPVPACVSKKRARQASILSPSRGATSIIRSTIPARTRCCCASREIVALVGSWALRWWDPYQRRWPSALISLPLPCFITCG